MSNTGSAQIVIIGGGPAGLMAAEQLVNAGYAVDLYDTMPTVGRKFLLAGVGGLNITHSEPLNAFCRRYAERQEELRPLLTAFGADELRQWCTELGIDTFVGTSGRVFPREMKAAPLLRKWLTRLKGKGLRIHSRHRWQGWDEQGRLVFQTPQGIVKETPSTLILALGGGSWKKLGSDGSWVALLQNRGVPINPLQPSNCGFLCHWSEHLRTRYAGSPLKSVTLTFTDLQGSTETRMGELMLTAQGVEGSLIYAFSARLRNSLNANGSATFYLDLLPRHQPEQLISSLKKKNKNKTLGSFLRNHFKLDSAKTALLFEVLDKAQGQNIPWLAKTLKAIPLTVTATTPIDEAISTAGGIPFEALNTDLMLVDLPGIFCAGEMLDWEAPTGGYLLTACFTTGRQAGRGAVKWLQTQSTAEDPV